VADRSVRLSQTLAPFGVGAIYDVLGDSFVACDTTLWKDQGRVVRAGRLERKLAVGRFKEAPSRATIWGSGSAAGIPYFRFPRWMFCTACRQMTNWSPRDEQPGEPARCSHCKARRQLVPMRFVMVCRDGHLADVPWHRWAHSTAESQDQKQCQMGPLFYRVRSSAGGGLRSLVVECGVNRCGAQRSLDGLTVPGAMKQLGISCRGLQPWQFPRADAEHDAVPEVVQRGASNVHFAQIDSAIDIPPESVHSDVSAKALAVTSHPMFGAIMSAPSGPIVEHLILGLAQALGMSEADVRSIVQNEIDGTIASPSAVEESEDLLWGEFLAFVAPQLESDVRNTFVTRRIELSLTDLTAPARAVTEPLVRMFDHVVVATKLREVRALVGFMRLDPGGTVTRPDLGKGLDWLPALEVYGEGIFLGVKESAVQAWESGPAARRIQSLIGRRANSRLAHWLPPVTPRFVLVHTLAHLLVRQMAFDSGYSSASLRERIYASPPSETGEGQAGVLIYTAAGDAEGTLGGLARLGEPERLTPLMLAMLQRSLWCSNDPICRDSPGQGLGALNRAACHACTLISETSCLYSNALLDRALVVGSPEDGVSFFEGEIRLALTRAADVVLTA
jgi:hypothetical protein